MKSFRETNREILLDNRIEIRKIIKYNLVTRYASATSLVISLFCLARVVVV